MESSKLEIPATPEEKKLITNIGLDITDQRVEIVRFLMKKNVPGTKLVKRNIKKIHIKSVEYLLKNQFKSDLNKIKKRHIKAIKLMIKNDLMIKPDNTGNLEKNKSTFKSVVSVIKNNETLAKRNIKACLYLHRGNCTINDTNVIYVNRYNLINQEDSPNDITEKIRAADIIEKNKIDNIESQPQKMIEHIITLVNTGFTSIQISTNHVKALKLLDVPSKERIEIITILLDDGVNYKDLKSNEDAIEEVLRMDDNKGALTKDNFYKCINSKNIIRDLRNINREPSESNNIEIATVLINLHKDINLKNFDIAEILYNIKEGSSSALTSKNFKIIEFLYKIKKSKKEKITSQSFKIAKRLLKIKNMDFEELTHKNFKIARAIFKTNGLNSKAINPESMKIAEAIYDLYNHNSKFITTKNMAVAERLKSLKSNITPDELDIALNINSHLGLSQITSENIDKSKIAKKKFGTKCSYLEIARAMEEQNMNSDDLEEVDEYQKITDNYAKTNSHTQRIRIALLMKKLHKSSPESVRAIEELIKLKPSDESILESDIQAAHNLIEKGKPVTEGNMLITSVMIKNKSKSPEDEAAIEQLLKFEKPGEIYDNDIQAVKKLIKQHKKVTALTLEQARRSLPNSKNLKSNKKPLSNLNEYPEEKS